MTGMPPRLAAAIFGLALSLGAVLVACGGGGEAEKPGERITDPARVPSSTPISQGNPTLYRIEGNEVQVSGGSSGAITPVATQGPGSTDYTVKSGDLCSTIAVEHKITVEQLQAANRNMDCNVLKVGDRLKIPSAAVATPTRGVIGGNPTTRPGGGSAKSYTVKPGDTCAGIAASHGVGTAAFLSANPSIDSDCTNLREGQVVTIP